MNSREYRVCTNCVMDTSDSLIQFDEKGVCDHCNNYYSKILPTWHTDDRGKQKLDQIVAQIKKDGKDKDHDCIIGVSGGVDSSYLLYFAKKVLGLRPLAFSVDTGWTLNVAVENIEKLVKGLNVDLVTDVVNWNEMRDLQLAYFKSQVPYQDMPQDHAIFASLYNYASKHQIKYVLTGGNYSTECVREPNEWVYVNDVTQMRDIHRRFGTIPLRTFPTCGMLKYRLYYRYFKNMRIVRPLDLIPYIKEDAIKILEQEIGWQRYANKHFESVFTRFYEGYWLVKKFGYDKRRAHFSSLILTKQMSRDAALAKLKDPPYDPELAQQDLKYVSKKLGISTEEFESLMKQGNKTFKDYKSNFWILQPIIKLAIAMGFEKRQFR